MDIRDGKVLILGGSGLVGMAIAREAAARGPAEVVISGLAREEAEEAVRELALAHPDVAWTPDWGDVFLPDDLREQRRADLLDDPQTRARLLDELFGPLTESMVTGSAFGALIDRHRPDLVVDCINTATVFAYQNLFASVSGLRERAAQGEIDLDSVERHLSTLYLPQLIRHVQVVLEATRRAGTRMYLKVGTAGTGGMGLNIPFTHSEERPSRVLLAKSSLAGAHTLLLYLMARTPGAPAVKEIKPTAAISWKRIGEGEVRKHGRPVPLVDAVRPVPLDDAFGEAAEGSWEEAGGTLSGVYLDAGENGFFSLGEFEALTALGLMEFITPEEIAANALREVEGRPSGKDVVAALDAATSGPTYRAGVLRQSALSGMEALERETGVESVAYEMLGPPRLSKLLFEAAILIRVVGRRLADLAAADPEETARRSQALLDADVDLRRRILSIGLPILLPAGDAVLRGRDLKVAPETGGADELDRMADRGMVDLRPANWRRWQDRISRIVGEIDGSPGADAGSRWDVEPWHREGVARPGALAAWIFRHEDGGERIKR
jgi:NAD(P)-dependent dehydrogenase (short-subunit alcohol dehydrogenase family)